MSLQKVKGRVQPVCSCGYRVYYLAQGHKGSADGHDGHSSKADREQVFLQEGQLLGDKFYHAAELLFEFLRRAELFPEIFKLGFSALHVGYEIIKKKDDHGQHGYKPRERIGQ